MKDDSLTLESNDINPDDDDHNESLMVRDDER